MNGEESEAPRPKGRGITSKFGQPGAWGSLFKTATQRTALIPALLNRAPSGKFNRARSEERGILACFGKTQRRGGDYWLFVICYSVSKVWGTEGQSVNIAKVLQGQFSGLGKGEAFHLALLTLDDFPALLHHRIQFIVISVMVVVEES